MFTRPPRQMMSPSSTRFALALAALCTGAATLAAPAVPLLAQDRPTVPPADYGRWENLGGASLSPFGDWIAYAVSRVNEENELRIREIDGDSTHVLPWGSAPSFSTDGRWLTWAVGMSSDDREQLEEAGDPTRNGVGVLDLDTWDERSFEAVRASAFDATGRYLALHGYEPGEPEGKGADVRVLDLRSGTETTFGNVAEFAWSDSLSLLAMAIATGEDAANGVQVYDAAGGRIQALDASGSAYRHLAWREGAADLAVLRSEEHASSEDAAYEVLAWRGLEGATAARFVLPEETDGMPPDMEIVRHAGPRWSDDGTMIAVGLRPEDDDDEDEDDAADEADEDDDDADDDEDPKLPGVQIWHSSDVRVYPQQKVSESRDLERTLTAVWHIDEGRVVQLGSRLLSRTRLLEGWRWAVETDDEPYPFGAMFGKPYHDIWRIELETGVRTRIAEHERYVWMSPGGTRMIAFDGEDYRTAEIGAASDGGHVLTESIPTVFADTAYDTPTDMLPPHGFGPGGWFEGDERVLLYDEHDIWSISMTGAPPVRLTDGAESGVTYRIAPMPDDDIPGLDPTGPIYLTMHDDRTEQRGYARLTPDGSVETLVFDDKYFLGLVKADSADVFAYRSMAFDDSPDYFVAGPDLADARRVSETNPFMSEYAWGRAELFDFTSETGRELQAGILLPANYTGGPVPTIVYTYEILTPQIHRFRPPSERDYYNYPAWTQRGYAVLLPDIVYEAREPGPSALAAVRAAVAKAVELGYTDASAVGLIGHSWGGYQATFLPTRTNIFAASVAGAPLTDFVSFMGQLHWNGGIPELSHWETGQGRMEVPFWEDPEAHRRSSPIHKVHEMETPLLMAHGNEDGVVDWDQATEFYNFARRAGKQMVLLVYEGENHGFRQKPNQVDYHRRILEWFGHYLKGEPAPAWITDGVKLEDLEDEKRRVARLVVSGDGSAAVDEHALVHGSAAGWHSRDWEIFEAKVRWATAEGLGALEAGPAIGRLAQSFVGTPYTPGTLEVEGPEGLVINFREFDCVTFVENMLAMTRFIQEGGGEALADPAAARRRYERYLADLRYRAGVIDGYPSRLHYFSEWLTDNASRGLMRVVTDELDPTLDDEPIDFMSTHPSSYRQLTDPGVLSAIREMEARLNDGRGRPFVPEARIADIADRIHDGDVIAATSTVEGLDIAHTGIALWIDGRLHLVHAPLIRGVVQVSEVSLADRIGSIASQDGIMVARPR